jgi:hypothetical protein
VFGSRWGPLGSAGSRGRWRKSGQGSEPRITLRDFRRRAAAARQGRDRSPGPPPARQAGRLSLAVEALAVEAELQLKAGQLLSKFGVEEPDHLHVEGYRPDQLDWPF